MQNFRLLSEVTILISHRLDRNYGLKANEVGEIYKDKEITYRVCHFGAC
jgi:hypothetical protein